MLRELSLNNYRCHERLELDFKPLTVFVGENNTGKSAALEAIWFLNQACQNNVPGLISHLESGGTRPLGFRRNSLISLGFQFDLTDHDLEVLSDMREPPNPIGIRIVLRDKQLGSQEVTLNKNAIITVTPQGAELNLDIFKKTGARAIFQGSPEVNRILAWEDREGDQSRSFNAPKDVLRHKATSMFYQPVERYPGKGTLTPENADSVDIGDGKFTSPRIHVLHSRKDPKFEDIEKEVGKLDPEIRGIISDWLGGEPTLMFETALGRFDVEAMGHGLKKATPILVQLITAPIDSIVLIEEPEANLHPGAVQFMTRFLLGMARTGIQIILSTHSGDLVHWLWHLVNRVDERHADDISVVVFKKDDEGNRSQEEQSLLGIDILEFLENMRLARFEVE